MKFRIWRFVGSFGLWYFWRLDVPVSIAVFLDDEARIVRTDHATFDDAVAEMSRIQRYIERAR